MFIRTKRLFLRPIFPEDWRATYAGLNDFAVAGALSRVPWPYTEEHARNSCANEQGLPALKFAITLPSTSGAPMIGAIDCGQRKDGAPYELSYWIARGRQGRGYATEAVAGILEIATTLRIPSIEAAHFSENPVSGSALQKCGFAPTCKSEPIPSLARGGELFLAKHYIRYL